MLKSQEQIFGKIKATPPVQQSRPQNKRKNSAGGTGKAQHPTLITREPFPRVGGGGGCNRPNRNKTATALAHERGRTRPKLCGLPQRCPREWEDERKKGGRKGGHRVGATERAGVNVEERVLNAPRRTQSRTEGADRRRRTQTRGSARARKRGAKRRKPLARYRSAVVSEPATAERRRRRARAGGTDAAARTGAQARRTAVRRRR